MEFYEKDATIARAKQLGAKIPVAPEDIPGVGRFGVFEDPTGAVRRECSRDRPPVETVAPLFGDVRPRAPPAVRAL